MYKVIILRDKWSAVVRRFNRLRAMLGGYFALPCPLCGREFYGFQLTRCGSIPKPGELGLSKMICPSCVREGKGVAFKF